MEKQDPAKENNSNTSGSTTDSYTSSGTGSTQGNTSSTYSSPAMKEDRQMLLILHLLQFLNFFTLIGGLIGPIILWQVKKDEVHKMDEQGKAVVNFQISLIIYGIVGFILTFILIGFLILFAVAVIGLIFPIINAIKANDGKPVNYPLSIKFFS